MSDYGSIILISKKDNSNITSSEMDMLKKELKSIIKEGNYSSEFEEGELEFKEWGDGSLCILLTEYFDDEDLEEYLEVIKEEELVETKNIVDELVLKLDSSFSIIHSFENW